MDGGAGRLGIARNLVVAAFLVSLLSGLLLPVYTDDMGWRFQERAAIDGVDRVYTDSCGPVSKAVPPLFMMPARHYSAFFNGLFPDPFWIRVSGVAYALALAGLVLVLLRRLLPDGERRRQATTVVFALLGLGVLPLLMVWSRPEQPLLLCLTGALILALPPRGKEPPFAGALRPAGIALLAAIALSYHMKAVVMAPAFLACIAVAARGREHLMARALAGAATLVLIASGAHYWFTRMQCPGNPGLARQYAGQNVLATLRSGEPLGEVVPTLLRNLSLPEYFALAAPRPVMMSEWLPSGLVSDGASKLWIVALTLGWMAAIVLAARAALPRLLHGLSARRVERPGLLGAVLLGIALAWGLSQVQRNTYEAIFVLPILALAVALLLGGADDEEARRPPLPRLAPVLAILALCSQVAVLAIYGPSMVESARRPGVSANQPMSLSVAGYPGVRRTVLAAARQCGIRPGRHLNGLMIDETTYLAFADSYRPNHWLGVTGAWKGSVSDPVAFLRSRRSSGIVMACRNLTPGLRAIAREREGICCVAPSDW